MDVDIEEKKRILAACEQLQRIADGVLHQTEGALVEINAPVVKRRVPAANRVEMAEEFLFHPVTVKSRLGGHDPDSGFTTGIVPRCNFTKAHVSCRHIG